MFFETDGKLWLASLAGVVSGVHGLAIQNHIITTTYIHFIESLDQLIAGRLGFLEMGATIPVVKYDLLNNIRLIWKKNKIEF